MTQPFFYQLYSIVTEGRLDHLLRSWGYATKDEVHRMAEAGRITVNGEVCLQGGHRCPEGAEIALDGRILPPLPCTTVMLNKPANYVCMGGDLRYPDVCSLIKQDPKLHTLFSIGRLDADTEGLLLMTNSGALSTAVANPAHAITKTYEVTTDRPLCADAEARLLAGAFAPGGEQYRPAKLIRTGPLTARVIVTEGKYHEVKRLIRYCGPYVTKLRRVAIGALQLDPELSSGAWRRLTPQEIERIFLRPAEAAGLPD